MSAREKMEWSVSVVLVATAVGVLGVWRRLAARDR
jgi:hypothetical protein